MTADPRALARECGAYLRITDNRIIFNPGQLKVFADALIHAERERCAAICEAESIEHRTDGNESVDLPARSLSFGAALGCERCAAAIRGETP